MSRAEIRIKARRLRLLRLYRYIGNPDVSPTALAKEMGCSRKVVASDMQALGLCDRDQPSIRATAQAEAQERAIAMAVDTYMRVLSERRGDKRAPKMSVSTED